MSKNDVLMLKGNFEEWKSRASDLKNPWLYYCIEQFIKPYTLDDEEIRSGITEGGGDGGADAIYFLVNQGQLVKEDTELPPKSVSKIRLLIIQTKSSGGFKPPDIEKWVQLMGDFLDLSKDADSYGTRYNKQIVSLMKIWKREYFRLSGTFPEKIDVDFYYITPDDAVPDDYAKDAGERVKKTVTDLIKASPNMHFIGAAELWKQIQLRPPKSKKLTWSAQPMQTNEGYVGLVKLPDFYTFLELEDNAGILNERIFESNVRGFQASSNVNEQIREELEKPHEKGNFWLLNNGITIICSQASGSPMHLVIEDPQIVNGLQTSRLIFSYFAKNMPLFLKSEMEKEKRTVLVRVIETPDSDLQNRIIRATNSQNKMDSSFLRMTDQIQRNIENFCQKFELYYDRRKGYYRDLGKPIRKIISANSMVQSLVSILLQRPDDARARPGNYFNDDDKYKSVFDNEIPVATYLSCVQIVRRVERFLDTLDLESGDKRNLVFYVSAMLARDLTGLEKPVPDKLPDFNEIEKIDDSEIAAVYLKVRKTYDFLSAKSGDNDTIARGPELLKRLNTQWKRKHGGKKKLTKKAEEAA